MKIVVDTNLIIDHLRGIAQATQLLAEIENGDFTGLISSITVLELMAAPKISESRLVAVQSLLEMFELIPVDRSIAVVAGKHLGKYRAAYGLEPMDAIIAATAYTCDAVLFTLNTKHFKFIEGLAVINPYITG